MAAARARASVALTAVDAPAPRVLAGLEAGKVQPHALHAEPHAWIEKNCYVDIWIEVLAALGVEPVAVMPFALAVDFEGDQWTFFKPPHRDLRRLYGIDVQELNVWRPLAEHAIEHLTAGKLLSTEVDAYWLPDVASTSYRRQHSKTTIVINEIDLARERLGYFHNAGYFELDGEDFRQALRLDVPAESDVLPLYAELIRFDRLVRMNDADLARASRELLQEHLALRPPDNPVRRFARRLSADLPGLLTSGLPHYHAWAFSTLRQCGAAFELMAAWLRWQALHGDASLVAAAPAFDRISEGCKTLILKLARAVNSQRMPDVQASLDDMAAAWDEAMATLEQHGGR
jgi:hypothetical protein